MAPAGGYRQVTPVIFISVLIFISGAKITLKAFLLYWYEGVRLSKK
jgi:hypothetical protein